MQESENLKQVIRNKMLGKEALFDKKMLLNAKY